MKAVVYGDPHKDGAADETVHPKIIAAAQAVNADVVVCLGDLKGTTGGNFDRFVSEIWPVKYRMKVLPGNWDHIGGDWLMYNDLARSLNGVQYRHYHWQTGDVTFVALDVWDPSEAPPTCTDYSEQQTYLTDVLTQSTTPFNIVLMHTPMIDNSLKGANDCAKYAFLPIIEASGKVQAVFAGHRHHYLRVKRPSGLNIVISGGAGAAIHPLLPDPLPGQMAASEDYHACSLETFEQNGELILHCEVYNVDEVLLDWWEVSVPAPIVPVKDETGGTRLTRK